MKVCVIQPPYSFKEGDLDACFKKVLTLLDNCDQTADIIVLPEHSDVPAHLNGKNAFYSAVEKNNKVLLQKAIQTAKRCNALVFVNAGYFGEKGIRNTTYAIDRTGNVVDKYFKVHPAPSEVKKDYEGGHELEVDYSLEYSSPHVVEIEGIKFAYLTCYDFYFYENFARLHVKKLTLLSVVHFKERIHRKRCLL